MRFLRQHAVILGTVLFDLLLLWTVFHFVIGGWDRAVRMVSQFPTVWSGILLVLLFLTLVRSDCRTDVPMYVSAFGLAYWLEWWGTTRGLWTYAGNQTPPIGEIFLWGICLLSVYHVTLLLGGAREGKATRVSIWIMIVPLLVLPLIGLVLTWRYMLRVDWMNYLDLHALAAVVLASFLIVKDFELKETFWVFVGGTFLGGLLEALGTASGRYAYTSTQGAPLLVGPVWGGICVVMVKLGYQIRKGCYTVLSVVRRRTCR